MKNILIKIIFLTALAGLIIYLDLTGFNQEINLEYYRNILSGTGYTRPFIYIGICIIAPNLMFPFAVVIMTGGIVFGCVKGMILTLIGGFLFLPLRDITLPGFWEERDYQGLFSG